LSGRAVGPEPRLERLSTLPHGTRAMLARPESDASSYEIHVVKGQERVLDHLVAHEVGHLVRLHQVPEAERLMPSTTPATRRRAAHQVVGELARLVAAGLRDEAIPELFLIWHGGVCSQLTSFPADLRIEAWIHQQFPD